MYADFNYYQTEYMGEVIESADNFTRYSKKAARLIDKLTTGKLHFAFPFDEQTANDVKDCECELAEFIYKVDRYNQIAMDNMGTITQSDGTVRGKVLTSVSSGSESRGYSANSATDTDIAQAAKSEEKFNEKVNTTVSDYLSFKSDANGIYLLYRGIPYPRSTKFVNPPPTYPKEKPTEPSNPQPPDNAENQGREDTESNLAENSKSDSGENDGIGYVDSVIVYNRYVRKTDEAEQYFGTRFDGVRIEFTQEENQNKAGKENTSVCLLKINNDSTLPKPYIGRVSWKNQTTEEMLNAFTLDVDGDFFVIVKRKGLNLDIDAPVGEQNSDDPPYNGNFFEYMKKKYDFVYSINSFEQKELIPYFQVGGL